MLPDKELSAWGPGHRIGPFPDASLVILLLSRQTKASRIDRQCSCNLTTPLISITFNLIILLIVLIELSQGVNKRDL
jgi:hypothetical protein